MVAREIPRFVCYLSCGVKQTASGRRSGHRGRLAIAQSWIIDNFLKNKQGAIAVCSPVLHTNQRSYTGFLKKLYFR